MIRILIVILLSSLTFGQESPKCEVIIEQENSPFRRPLALAHGLDGLLYVADTGNGRLVALDSTGKIAFESSKGGSMSELRWPVDVAVGSGGRVYVADSGNRRIVEFSRLLEWKGELIVAGDDGIALEPRLLATSPSGDLFVYESDNGQFIRYDSFFNVVSRLGGQSGRAVSLPTTMTFAAIQGLLWIDQQEHKVYQCDEFLIEPRLFHISSGIQESHQLSAVDSIFFTISDSTLIRHSLGRNETLTLSEMGLADKRPRDLKIEAVSQHLLYLLDTRRGTLHRLYWP